MKTFLLAPDSFKGTLSAAQVCAIQSSVIRKHVPGAVIHAIPMADGGEGMVESYLGIMGGRRVTASVTAPLGGTVDAVYGVLPDGSAVMEMASAAGLSLAAGRENPLEATTYGVGELLLHAAASGIRKVLLGIGGSCTNDCGIGMAAALGFRFLDCGGRPVEPLAKNLGRIRQILPPASLPELDLRVACDVDNPLLGEHGATYTFGPQKGADAAMLAQLEAGMTQFAQVLTAFSGIPAASFPGGGAAGGLGAALRILLGGRLMPGAELLLDSVGFDALLREADIVWTGEGRIDWQSAHGKVPGAVGRRCAAAGVPCVALCGSIGKGAGLLYDSGISAIFSAVQGACSFEEVQQASAASLEFLADAVLRLLTLQDRH